jgi:hypothetical protein
LKRGSRPSTLRSKGSAPSGRVRQATDPRIDHSRFFCMDCDVDTYVNQQYYILKDGLWKSINRAIDGMLCLGCAEKRLGRPLSRKDFKKAPLNQGQARVCAELAARLRRDP